MFLNSGWFKKTVVTLPGPRKHREARLAAITQMQPKHGSGSLASPTSSKVSLQAVPSWLCSPSRRDRLTPSVLPDLRLCLSDGEGDNMPPHEEEAHGCLAQNWGGGSELWWKGPLC